jgi:hypothetical protein
MGSVVAEYLKSGPVHYDTKDKDPAMENPNLVTNENAL